MSVLEFKGYTVNKMIYEKNNNFLDSNKNISLNPKLSAESTSDNSNITIKLSVSVGSFEDTSTPFRVQCEVEGRFIYNIDEDENDFGKDVFIKNNCVAILYPYVRAIVGTLVSSSNEFPGYYMPTINVSKALSEDAE